ncbi:hypothetical protein [Marinobacter sp.]|uniref:hypothetical protein n=1 Tax=Marinobacter sp. TaxID=50741 RepID=UPI0034A33348
MKGQIPESGNIQFIKRDSDMSVTVVFASCRSAGAFARALETDRKANPLRDGPAISYRPPEQ